MLIHHCSSSTLFYHYIMVGVTFSFRVLSLLLLLSSIQIKQLGEVKINLLQSWFITFLVFEIFQEIIHQEIRMTLIWHSCSSLDGSRSFETGMRHIRILKTELCPPDNGDRIVEERVVLFQWLQVFCSQGIDIDFYRLLVAGCSSCVHWFGAWRWRRSHLGWSGGEHCREEDVVVWLQEVSWQVL